jgi:hypothetical protein
VVYESGPKFATLNSRRRYEWLDVRNKSRRRLRAAGQLPAQHINESGSLRCTRIVEALSVKVLRKLWGAGSLLHE